MIKQNQTYLNRLHVVMDAVCIYFAGFAAWYIRFKCTIFGFWLNQENFRSQPLLSRVLSISETADQLFDPVIVIVFVLWSLYTKALPTWFQGTCESGQSESDRTWTFCICDHCMADSELSSFFISVTFIYLTLIFGLLSRYIIRRILKTNRKKGRNIKHTVFIGFSTSAAAYIDRIKSNPQWGLKVHGIFDDLVSDNFEYRGIKKIGTLSDLAAYLEKTSLDEVAITLNLNEYHKLEQIVAICEKSGVHTKFVPDYYNFISTNPYTEDLDGLPVINIRNVPLTNTMNKLIKRLIDIIGSIIALILFSPIMLIVAILVKKSSPGPIIFAQERIGLGNKPFKMYKFRSMGVQDPKKEAKEWTTKNDVRVTPVGRVIRKTSLDELPQFWNVLKGDMSLIGPRPERPLFVEKFKEEIPRYMIKHQVRPGITGWAQVNGFRGDTSIRSRIEHDLYYIENWSLGLDIKILFLTFFKGFVNKNAY